MPGTLARSRDRTRPEGPAPTIVTYLPREHDIQSILSLETGNDNWGDIHGGCLEG